MLKTLEVDSNGKSEKYVCVHWRTFPPPGAGQDADTLRANQAITTEQHNRLKLWERICGLFQMQESKCMSCPHRRRIEWQTRGPVLTSPDGTVTPVVDAASGESAPRNRHLANIFRRPGTKGSHKPAAWVEQAQKTGEGDGDG